MTARSTRSGSAPRSTRPSIALLDDADFAKYPFLAKGYIGPKALLANGVRYLVDPRVVDGTSWITGADAPGKHVVGLVAGRDFVADGTIEAAEVRDGDPSPDGAGPLVSARGIEIGHIFQLGRKYTDAFTADVLGEDGKPVRLTMGSYGIGVSRLVAVIAEQHHDELGLRWPSSVSPFDAHVVIANKDSAARAGASELAADLDRLGVEVLLDDRQASPGVKFKDAELLGVPWLVVVGRGWADGVVELRNRFTGETREVPVDDAADGHLGGRRGKLGFSAICAAGLSIGSGSTTLLQQIGAGQVRSGQLLAAAGKRHGDRPDVEHLAPAGRRDRALRQRGHREGPILIGGRLLEHRPPRDRGILFHPDGQVGGVGRVVDLRRQLVAGGRQRWVHRAAAQHRDGLLTAVAVLGDRGRHQVVEVRRRMC